MGDPIEQMFLEYWDRALLKEIKSSSAVFKSPK